MNAGQLRHRVTIQARTITQDSSGDPVVSWSTLGTVWGSIEPIRGREATFAGEQVLGETDTRIRLRYSPAAAQVTAGHRLEHQGALFDVVSVAHVKLAQREIEIMAKSGVSAGG